jgi:hypothetical protein
LSFYFTNENSRQESELQLASEHRNIFGELKDIKHELTLLTQLTHQVAQNAIGIQEKPSAAVQLQSSIEQSDKQHATAVQRNDGGLYHNDLNVILEALESGGFQKNKWIDLGVRMGLFLNTLKEIEGNYKNDGLSRCLMEMIHKWLRRADDVSSKGRPSWESLADALRKMDERASADYILCHSVKCDMSSVGTQSSHQNSAIVDLVKDASQSLLDENKEQMKKLLKKMELITSKPQEDINHQLMEEMTKEIEQLNRMNEKLKENVDELSQLKHNLIETNIDKQELSLELEKSKSSYETIAQQMAQKTIQMEELTENNRRILLELKSVKEDFDQKMHRESRMSNQLTLDLKIKDDMNKELTVENKRLTAEVEFLKGKLMTSELCLSQTISKQIENFKISSTYLRPPSPSVLSHHVSYPHMNFGPLRIQENELIGTQEVLGSGQICSVKQGIYNPRHGDPEKCAIKTHHRYTDQISNTLREAYIISMLNNPNIVKIYGVCINEPISLVMELAQLGSLDKFLKGPLHVASNPQGEARYVLITGARKEYASYRIFPSVKILNLMIQVAQGLAYLENMRIVHCNLSAQNILVLNEEKVKISGFSKSRVLNNGTSYYLADDRITWPSLKWCAPESISEGKFSCKSDVWSYGVAMWEAFSYGLKTPYQSMEDADVMKMLKLNKRLERPPKCPPPVYDEMLKCWSWTPEERPSPSELVYKLRKIQQTWQ